jgi:hypothetical protein
MNFIAYFSVPCMVSEEEQDYEHVCLFLLARTCHTRALVLYNVE